MPVAVLQLPEMLQQRADVPFATLLMPMVLLTRAH
jgi:hypothetical protein